MTILNQNYFFSILVVVAIFSFAVLRHEKGYYNWVKRYWFYRQSKTSKISIIIYILGFSALSFALLDLRGREERIEAEVPDQRTVIVIDTSASMLTEDVKPSRFERSIFLARHFIKQATGHQISVVIFSDMTKRLIPFTNDLDLLDARVSALSSMDIYTGGSNIQLAINQAVQYLKADNNNRRAIGNILLITDGEEQQAGTKLEVPEGVLLAMIGVGTARGGRIPLRTREGTFRGYKRSSGEEVVSKLEEDFFREITRNTPGSKYWIATSYSVNSSDILAHMNTAYEREMRDGEIKIQPVLGLPIIWIGLILLALGSLFSNLKSFKSLALLLIILPPLYIGELSLRAEEVAESKLSERGLFLVEEFSQGRLNLNQQLELTEELIRSEMYSEANILNEELNKNIPALKYDMDFQLNRGTTKLMLGDWINSKKIFDDVRHNAEGDKLDIVDNLIRNNYLLAAQLQQQEQEKQESQGKDEEEQKKDSGEGENNKDEDSEGAKDQNESGENDSPETSENNQDEMKDESETEAEQESENKEKNNEDGENEPKEDIIEEIENKDTSKSAKREDLPGLIQQIMNDDRSLQERQLDTSTNDSKRTRQQRDW